MLAIVPARAGSKGIPGKNLKPLLGRPLIAYTIDVAREAASITRIVVSTDSEEIAEAARAAGADVPFLRPAELASDDSPALDAYLYTLDRLDGAPAKEFIVLQPTSPLRTAADIEAAVRIFKGRSADSVISVAQSHPVTWHRTIDAKGVLREEAPSAGGLANRQAYSPTYVPNGAIFIFNRRFVQETRRYYSDKTYPYVMPAERSVDIDTPFDFTVAEALMERERV